MQKLLDAARELVRRQDAAEDLIAFTEYTHTQYKTAAHHRLIAQKLQQVERGEISRLMIFMPPRHGKSELASRRFPAWYLGRHPERQIITASYNADLASDFGRDVRNIVGSAEFRNVFPITLAHDSHAANRWHTNKGGSYVAAGVGTAITGRGAHILLIDDPVKDRADADSELIRKATWDWYRSTAYTRLMPGGAVILIQTRWHEDDLAGRLLDDSWDVLSLPALAEDDDPLNRQVGEALWPAWYDREVLDKTRTVVGDREWSALYQQKPQADEGEYFKREWIRYYQDLPENLRYWGGSDYAVTANGGDYTVHGVIGVTADQDLYVVDWWRQRETTELWIEAFLNLARQWQPVLWGEESGQILKSLDPFITRRMRETHTYVTREQFVPSRDKATRARAIQGRMSMGKVFLPAEASWTAELVTELLKFPFGKHDDQVDVLSLFGMMLDKLWGRSVTKPKEAPGPFSGQFVLDQLEAMDAPKGRYG
jgi:predicted phage terminase large subunit-like protein